MGMVRVALLDELCSRMLGLLVVEGDLRARLAEHPHACSADAARASCDQCRLPSQRKCDGHSDTTAYSQCPVTLIRALVPHRTPATLCWRSPAHIPVSSAVGRARHASDPTRLRGCAMRKSLVGHLRPGHLRVS